MTERSRIMVVEDEPVLAEDISRILRLAHYEVVAKVHSGELAVEKAAELKPDLILMDILLEDEMDGIEAAEIIQAEVDAAIVFLTAHSDRHMFQRAKRTELYGFLSKPITERDLLYAVEMALYRHKMERELTLARRELERRVDERTAELMAANERLTLEIAERTKAQKALEASEERYRRLVEDAADIIFMTDDAGYVTYSNPVALRIMGYSAEELAGMHYLDFIPGSYKKEAARFYRMQFEKRIPDTYHEWPAVTKAGELLWLGQNVHLLVEDDTVKGFQSLSRDVTRRKEMEIALKESEERYRTICETATDSIFVKDRNLKYTHANAAMQKLFGYKPGELIGKTDEHLFGPEHSAQLREIDLRVLSGEIVSQENTRPVQDHSTTFHVVKVPLRDADGQIAGLCGIARDITRRKKAEEAIRESEERYRLLTQNSLTGIYIIQDDRFVLANERLARIIGHKVEDILGRTFWQFVHPDDREMVKQRETQRLQGKENAPHYEFRVIHKDGRTVWIELLATTIPFGGRMANMGNLADITERKESQKALKQAYDLLEKRVAERTAELSQKNLELNEQMAERTRVEQALRENEARFREFAELLPEIVFETDERGMVTFINQRAYSIVGCSPKDIEQGFPAINLLAPQDRERAKKNLGRLLREETPKMTEYTALRKDGSTFPVLAGSTPVIRDGKPVGLRVIIIDISHIRHAENALRLEKRRFETLAENSPLGLVVLSEDGKYLYSNPKLTDLFGYEPKNAEEGLYWFRQAFPDRKYRRTVVSEWSADLKKSRPGEMRSRIYTVRCKDGTEKVVHFRPVQLETGEHFVTCEDITERKRAQEALSKSERRFRTLVETAKDFIWTLDLNLRSTYASPAVTDLLGYTVEEFMSMDPLETFSVSSRKRILEAFSEDLEREKTKPGASDAARFEDVTQFRKDGSPVWLEVTTTFLRDQENRVQGILAISHDITHRKEAEESIRRSEETARALLNATTDAAVLVDAKGTVLASNYVFARSYGLTPDELTGTNLVELYPSDLREYREARGREVVSTGKPLRFVDAYNNTYLDHSLYPLFDERGAVERLAIFIRDITDQVKAEKELRIAKETAEISNRAKSQFLASMSHELRTPLNAIIGFSEILEDRNFGPMNAAQLEFVGHILNSGRHLLRLINDVLDLSKVESGKIELQIDKVRLYDLLGDSLVMVTEKARKHNLNLNFVPDETLTGEPIYADEVKLKQILFNLLSNAVKFTPDGGRIELHASREGDEFLVRVADTGVGVEPDDVDRIFGVFEQVDSTLARQREGTGLGLALTKRLVELHGGRIWVDSPGRNQGSTFTFTIPLSLVGVATLSDRAQGDRAAPSRAMDRLDMGKDRLEELTRIWNRNEIVKRFEEERNRPRSGGIGTGIIVLCVSNYEDVAEAADVHEANVLLAEVAWRLLSSLRPTDAVGRSGLDEFVVLLPGCNQEYARKTADRLLRHLTKTPVSTRKGVFPVVVSMGVLASTTEDGRDAASVIRTARDASLRARHRGGNRVELWEASSSNR